MQSLLLAQHHPHLRFVVQDREPVVGDAVEVRVFNPLTPLGRYVPENILDLQFWKKNMPTALESGRVRIQGRSLPPL